MYALISGQAAQAVLVNQNKVFLYRLDDDIDTSGVEIPVTDIPRVFQACTDVRKVHPVTTAGVRQELESDWAKDRALHLMMILLDPQEEHENRRLASECINDLFVDSAVQQFVALFMYASPLPDVGQLNTASDIATTAVNDRVLAFVQQLAMNQAAIRKRCEAWDNIPLSLFSSYSHKDEMRRVMVNEGAFWLFVTETKQDGALLKLLVSCRIGGIKNSRQILQQWAAPFHEKVDNVSFDGWTEASQYDEDESTRPYHSRPYASTRDILENVNKQKDAVKEALTNGDRRKAWRFARQLVVSQHDNSEPHHIAMSLCDLSQHAKRLGDTFLHLHFSLWAVRECASDAWAHHQVGDAYNMMGQYERALEAFQKCGLYGDECMALCGRAEVLKDSGAFEQAVAVFTQCAEHFQDTPGPLNGLAATLAMYGRLDRALAKYDDINKRFPCHRITLCGRATVLREMGRLSQALEAINDVLHTLGPDSVALCTKAGILRDQNKLAEAAGIYRDVITADRLNIYALIGLATTYKMQGQFDAAVTVFTTVANQFRRDPFGMIGRAGVWKVAGELDAARDEYTKALRRFPNHQHARNGLASLLASSEEFDAALSLLPDSLPSSQADWVAYHIRGMTWLKMGKVDESCKLFAYGIENTPWVAERQFFQTAMSVALMKQRNFHAACQTMPTIEEASPAILPAVTLLHLHICAELKQQTVAKFHYDNLRVNLPNFYPDIREKLYRQYFTIYPRDAGPSEYAIIDDECNLLLLAS